jgi:hypothetical protein
MGAMTQPHQSLEMRVEHPSWNGFAAKGLKLEDLAASHQQNRLLAGFHSGGKDMGRDLVVAVSFFCW